MITATELAQMEYAGISVQCVSNTDTKKIERHLRFVECCEITFFRAPKKYKYLIFAS